MSPEQETIGVWIVAGIVIGAWLFLAWQVEIGARERDRQRKAASLAAMDAAGKPKMGRE